MPLPNAVSWSDKFPSVSSPAAVKLDRTHFSRIREVPLPKPQWLGETAKEATKERAFTFDYSRLRLGEFVDRVRAMRKSLPELGQSQKKTVEEYVVRLFRLEQDTVSCLATGACPQALESEGTQKKFAGAQSKLKEDWLSAQMGSPYEQLSGLAESRQLPISEQPPASQQPPAGPKSASSVSAPAPEAGPIFELPECDGKRCVVQNPGVFVPCATRATIGIPQSNPPIESLLPPDPPAEAPGTEGAGMCSIAYINFRQNMQSNIQVLRGAEVRQWSDSFLLSEHQQVVQFKRTSSQQNTVRCPATNAAIASYTRALLFCSTLP